jgi:phosphoribosylglycinamide formyltransferase 1
MKKILVFASGNGTNAEKIFQHFEQHPRVKVIGLCCNKEGAGVVEKAEKYSIPVWLITASQLNSLEFLKQIQEQKPDLVVLSGFLLKIPESLVQAFPNQIVNIHPALLPNYGGKGMYGMHVHQAVFDHMEKETGITIHYVNEQYDEGAIIFQAKTDISGCSSPDEIATKVHELEHIHFSKVIEQILL